MTLHKTHEGFMMGTSILSAVSSATIIAAYAGIPAVRKRKYFEALFYIGISNFITSVGSSFGLVRDDSPECWVQGILTNVFSLASIAWTVVISMMLNHAIVEAKMMEITPLIHAVCWSLPMVVTFIPLVELEFSSFDGTSWCFFDSDDDGYSFEKLTLWRWVGFYFWVLFGVAVIIYLFAVVYQKKETMFKENIIKIVDKLKYYPLVIVICWLPAAIYDTIPYSTRYMNITATTLACLHGLLVGVVFWAQNYQLLLFLKEVNPDGGATVALANVPTHQIQSPIFQEYNNVGENSKNSSMSGEGALRSTQMGWTMTHMSNSESTKSASLYSPFYN